MLTLVLDLSCIAGVLLSARHWWGWLIGAGSEVLWTWHGLVIHDHAIRNLAVALFLFNTFNAVRIWRDRHGSHREGAPSAG